MSCHYKIREGEREGGITNYGQLSSYSIMLFNK